MSQENATHSETGTEPNGAVMIDARLAVVVRIEWSLLAIRYVAFFALFGAYASGATPLDVPALLAVTVGIVLQNAFVHWVLYSQRYHLFLTPFNFFLYLGKISLIVGISGAEGSPLVMLYLLFIVGYCTYTPHFLNTVWVALICCSAYAFTILIRWIFVGVSPLYQPIATTFAAILIGGWLIRRQGDLLRNMRLEAEARTQALASSEGTMRTILDNTAEPIVIYGENEFISQVNDRACGFLGMTRDELIGIRFRSFLFDDGTLPNRIAALRARGEYHGELIVVPADGDEKSVEMWIRSFLRDGKRLYVCMWHDITREKDLQEASRLANIRLEQVNLELQRVDELRTAVATTVAHRLRSPLSAILGFLDLLLHEELGPVSEEQRKSLQSIRRSALRILELADEPFELGLTDSVVQSNTATESQQKSNQHKP